MSGSQAKIYPQVRPIISVYLHRSQTLISIEFSLTRLSFIVFILLAIVKISAICLISITRYGVSRVIRAKLSYRNALFGVYLQS